MNKKTNRFYDIIDGNIRFYLICIYIIGIIIYMFDNTFYILHLSLNFDAIFSGEVWRLFTFMLAPIGTTPFDTILELYIVYIVGKYLERVWGSKKYLMYLIIGIISIILVAFVAQYILNEPPVIIMFIGNYMFNFSMILTFTVVFPDEVFLFFFVLPIKAKYISLINLGYMGYYFIKGGPLRYGAVAGLLALLIMTIYIKGFNNTFRKNKNKVAFNSNFNNNIKKELKNIPRHKCEVCGITDLDDPDMEFRYCSKCNGMYEYCSNHIKNHEHKR